VCIGHEEDSQLLQEVSAAPTL
jgi:hypothetical protein